MFFCMAQAAFGQGEVSKVGTTAANFLKLEVGARAVGMAGAYTAVADDIYSMKWNPAGLTGVDQLTVAYNNISLYADLKHWFAGLVVPMGSQAIGLSINYLDIGKIEKTTINDPDGTGLFFSSYNFDISVSYARNLTDRIKFGVTGRFIHEQIWQEKANGYAGDIGVIFNPGVSGLKLGMSVTNFGPDMMMDEGPLRTFSDIPLDAQPGVGNRSLDARYDVESHALPVSFQMGAAFELMGVNNMLFESPDNRVALVWEIQDSFDNKMRNKLALEYEWNNILSLRAGYKENYDLATYSFGGGIRVPLSGMNVKVDYAFAKYGDLGDINVTSIEIGF